MKTILQLFFNESNLVKCWFLMRGENRSTRGKTSQSRVENQQIQSTYDSECRNRTQSSLVKGKCSPTNHHYANPATSCSYISHTFLASSQSSTNIFGVGSLKSQPQASTVCRFLKFSYWRFGDITTKGITSSDIMRAFVLASPSCKPRGFSF